MPLYFFHLENGRRISADQGDEFPDDRAAMQAAQEIGRDFSKNRTGAGLLRIVVTNQAGELVGDEPLL